MSEQLFILTPTAEHKDVHWADKWVEANPEQSERIHNSIESARKAGQLWGNEVLYEKDVVDKLGQTAVTTSAELEQPSVKAAAA